MSPPVGADLSGVTDELRRKILQAIADPGHFLKRGGDYTEPIPEWSARAVALVLDEWLAGCTVVHLPEPDGTSYEGDPIWGAHVDYEDVIFASVQDGHPVVDGPIGDEPLPADVAEMFGLRLIAAAFAARRQAAGSGVGDPR